MGPSGTAGWFVALLASALTWSCTHQQPKPAAPVADVAAALQPCPPELETKSVKEILARMWVKRSCFAVRGRLTATYGNPSYLRNRLLGASAAEAAGDVAGAAGEAPLAPQALGWVLTDLADPFTPRRDDDDQGAQPTITLMTTGKYQPWLLPLLRCNRDDDGLLIMPPATRFELPGYRLTDVERLDAGLAGLTVVVFGGKQAGDFNPDGLYRFNDMFITHVCRLDAPPDAGAQDGD